MPHKPKPRKNWAVAEDREIEKLVKIHGCREWLTIANILSSKPGARKRSSKQCRERWHNHLNPDISKARWTREEEQLMFDLHRQYGNRWTLIAAEMPKRTDNCVKNHFYSVIRRSLRRMCKIVGRKNSTPSIRLIKPATLSKFFLAGTMTHSDELEVLDESISKYLKENYSHVTRRLIDLARQKPSEKPEQETVSQYREIIDKIEEINDCIKRIKREQRSKRNVRWTDSVQDSDQQSHHQEESSSSIHQSPPPPIAMAKIRTVRQPRADKKAPVQSKAVRNSVTCPLLVSVPNQTSVKKQPSFRGQPTFTLQNPLTFGEQPECQNDVPDQLLYNESKGDENSSVNSTPNSFMAVNYPHFSLAPSPGAQPDVSRFHNEIINFDAQECDDIVVKTRQRIMERVRPFSEQAFYSVTPLLSRNRSQRQSQFQSDREIAES